MKNGCKLLCLSVGMFFCSCSMTDDPSNMFSEKDGQTKTLNIPDLTGDWKMVVYAVETYEGNYQDRVFVDILLGRPVESGTETTNTTNFTFDTHNNKMNLILPHVGRTIWETDGLDSIEWNFNYNISKKVLTFEGLADTLLSSCEISKDSKLENKFRFEAFEDPSAPYNNYYFGYFEWTETYDSIVCLRIDGSMEVYKSID